MQQTFTSAMTSINSSRLPAIYRAYGIHGDIFDYGCGRYTDHIEDAVKAAGYKYFCYDKYNRSSADNAAAFAAIESANIDYVFCSNVLNVIDDDETIAMIAKELVSIAAAHHARVVITVYEGDKSGIGRPTKIDCYQRNEKLAAYKRFFDGYLVFVSRGYMVVNPQ